MEVPLISTESDVFDFTIIDCPPRYDEEMRGLMILADYVIVPIPIFPGTYYEDHFIKYCDPSKSILIPVCLSDFCIHPEVKGFFMLDDQYHFKGNVDFESTMIAKRLVSYILSL